MRSLLLALLIAPVWAQSPARLAPSKLAEIERLISQEMARQNIPGLSAAAGHGGALRWSAGYGLADVENHVPAKALTAYRLGSISKPITSAAILQMVEAGKMDLDAPIRRYVPEFPNKPWPIPIRLLLGHLGGIRHYAGPDEINSTRHYQDLAGALQIFDDDPLIAEPGTKYHYTTYGYVLLGLALERASGLRYIDYARQRIFTPAGMERARQDHTFAIIPNRARGYTISTSGNLQNCALADTSNKIPGGGLISTVEDLVKFGLAVRGTGLLKPASVELMFTPQKLRDGSPSSYGMGWTVGEREGRKVVYHGGGQQGVTTMLTVFPKDGIVVALMCNLERARLRELSMQMAKIAVP